MSSDRARPRLNITIDRLVLNGFPPAARGPLVAGFHAELRRLAAAPGHFFGGSRAAPALRTRRLRADGAASPSALGAAAARELWRGFRR